MSPEVLRRKLQKKIKHKPYRKCPRCGKRMSLLLRWPDGSETWRLYKACDWLDGCGRYEELFWSGGGNGRHIPGA